MQEMATRLRGSNTGPVVNRVKQYIQISIVSADNGWIVSAFGDSFPQKQLVAENHTDVANIVDGLVQEFDLGREF